MASPILHLPEGHRPWPDQTLIGELALARGRLHEFCGPARAMLAAWVMRQSQGTVIWAFPGWQAERIFAPGLAHHADPGRVIFVRARRPEDILWAMEEALRSGVAPLVVGEVLVPPALTPVRRLHLAAEAGAERARHAGGLPPLALVLTPGDGGAQGVESRWHLQAIPSGSTLYEPRQAWKLTRTRARMAPVASWAVRGQGKRLWLEPDQAPALR